MDSMRKASAGEMGKRVNELYAEQVERRLAPVALSPSGNNDGENAPVGKSSLKNV